MIFRFLLVLAILVCSAQAQTKFVKSVPTLTELRALNVADIHTNVLVNSYWTSNTNSIGAIFQWVPGATDATNTYSVFAPASGTGRWIRVETPANPGPLRSLGFGSSTINGPGCSLGWEQILSGLLQTERNGGELHLRVCCRPQGHRPSKRLRESLR